MITKIKTDRELVQEAARLLATAYTEKDFDAACIEMVETLKYARSTDWWEERL